MKNVTISDVAKLAGVGTATVDRVLNGRSSTKTTTQDKVLAAARELGYRIKQSQLLSSDQEPLDNTPNSFKMGLVLLSDTHSFYKALSESLIKFAPEFSTEALEFAFFDLDQIEAVANTIRKFAETMDVIGIIALDHPLIRHAVSEATSKGVKVVTLISDLSPCNQSAYIGFDNKQLGRTAAWAAEHFFLETGKIGIVLGDYRFQCQETYEISFRSYLRECARDYQVLEPVKSFESIQGGYDAVINLFKEHDDISLLYIPCGGAEGMFQALNDLGKSDTVKVICHGPFIDYQLRLIDRSIDLMFFQPVNELAKKTLDICSDLLKGKETGFVNVLINFNIITRENMP